MAKTLEHSEALRHLRKGWPVVADGLLVESPVAYHGAHGRRLVSLPARAEGEGEATYQAARHADGSWTREGLEAIIRSGGSVMVGRDSVLHVADLPEAEELAAGDAQKHEALLEDLDRQAADLSARRAAAQRKHDEARAAAGRRQADDGPGEPEPPKPEPPLGPPPDLPEGVPAHPGQPQLPEEPVEEEGQMFGQRRHRGKK